MADSHMLEALDISFSLQYGFSQRHLAMCVQQTKLVTKPMLGALCKNDRMAVAQFASVYGTMQRIPSGIGWAYQACKM